VKPENAPTPKGSFPALQDTTSWSGSLLAPNTADYESNVSFGELQYRKYVEFASTLAHTAGGFHLVAQLHGTYSL